MVLLVAVNQSIGLVVDTLQSLPNIVGCIIAIVSYTAYKLYKSQNGVLYSVAAG